jgi:hypothetical protein
VHFIFLSALEKTVEAGKMAYHRETKREPRLTGDKMFGTGKARFLFLLYYDKPLLPFRRGEGFV